jgi:aryl carrier-like protein
VNKTPTDIADVLDRAADHIETVGWWQGALYDHEQAISTPLDQCAVCAMGALNVALHGTPHFARELQANEPTAHDVAELIEQGLDGVELADWNDRPGRTQDDVTALLRRTADELRGGAQ